MADEEDKKPPKKHPGRFKRTDAERRMLPKHKRDPRIKQVIKNMLSGMTLNDAGLAAGYSENYMRSSVYNYGTADYIKAQVARRMTDARAKAAIHTDSIVGSLVEIMQASPADILPDHPVLQKAKENGVDHLIRELSITPIRVGERTRKNKDGTVTTSPVIREKIDLKMYSRLDAIAQLRDNFGMKQEPRANSFEETKRQEVERGIRDIMVAESCDQTKAAELLLANIGDAPHLVPIIQKYIKKQKKESKEPIQVSGIN